MKVTSKQLALLAAILAIVFGGAGRTSAAETTAVSKPELEANIKYCEICHGIRPMLSRILSDPAARRTNTRLPYVCIASIRRTQANKQYHVPRCEPLSPGMQTALAAHFHDLHPKPVGGAPADLVAAGKKVFEEGVAPRGGGALSRAAPATETTQKATRIFLGWRVSSMITSSTSSRTGAKSLANNRRKRMSQE